VHVSCLRLFIILGQSSDKDIGPIPVWNAQAPARTGRMFRGQEF